VQQHQYFFLWMQISPLDQKDIVKGANTRNIKLQKLTYSFSYNFTIAAPKDTKRFVHCPPDAFYNKLGIHMVRAVLGRYMHTPSLASELIDRSQYAANMNGIVARCYSMRHLLVLQVGDAIVEALSLIQIARILVIINSGKDLAELPTVQIDRLPIPLDEAALSRNELV
jgi:hypothetical protein